MSPDVRLDGEWVPFVDWFGDIGKCLAILYLRLLGCHCPPSHLSNAVFAYGLLLVFCCCGISQTNTANGGSGRILSTSTKPSSRSSRIKSEAALRCSFKDFE